VQNKQQEQEETLREELQENIKNLLRQFMAWIKPNKSDAIYLQILKLLLKIPVLLIMTILSPILAIVLLFAFAVVA
jgi:hypothetical protein